MTKEKKEKSVGGEGPKKVPKTSKKMNYNIMRLSKEELALKKQRKELKKHMEKYRLPLGLIA